MIAQCDLTIENVSVGDRTAWRPPIPVVDTKLIVPLETIENVRAHPPRVREAWRTVTFSEVRVGSWIPGVYRAGSFCPFANRAGKVTSWWLVRRPGNTIELSLRGFRYDRVIVEVDDSDGATSRLLDAIGGRKHA